MIEGGMVSANEAGFNLRENFPPSRKTLQDSAGGQLKLSAVGTPIWEIRHGVRQPAACPLSPIGRGWRGGERVRKDRRDWTRGRPSPKEGVSHLIYLAPVRDSAESGLGCFANRRLTHPKSSLA